MQHAKPGFRMFYVDDSGAPDTGHMVYAWIEVTPEHWRQGLAWWLRMRQDIYAQFKVPPSYELHATKLIGGRSHPSTKQEINASKARRREIMTAVLHCMSLNPFIRCGAVHRHTELRGKEYYKQRSDLYASWLTTLDERLAANGEFALIMMDGNGSDNSYLPAHRRMRLSTRRILEDPIFQQSHVSQWVQMADVAAWTTYQHLIRHEGKQFAWEWFNTYLEPKLFDDLRAL